MFTFLEERDKWAPVHIFMPGLLTTFGGLHLDIRNNNRNLDIGYFMVKREGPTLLRD